MSHLNNICSSQQTLPRLSVEVSEMTIILYGLGVIQQLRGPNFTLFDLLGSFHNLRLHFLKFFDPVHTLVCTFTIVKLAFF